jgi:hypothetical protein
MGRNKIYKELDGYWIYTHTTPDGCVYVGMSGTKHTYDRWQSGSYLKTGLGPDIEKWGWDNIKHEIIKDGLTKEEALEMEEEIRLFCEKNGVSLNKNRTGMVIEKSGGYNEYHASYREEHRDAAKNKTKEWRKNNSERHRENCRRWFDENPYYYRVWYEKNRGIMKKKYHIRYLEKKWNKEMKENGYISLF